MTLDVRAFLQLAALYGRYVLEFSALAFIAILFLCALNHRELLILEESVVLDGCARSETAEQLRGVSDEFSVRESDGKCTVYLKGPVPFGAQSLWLRALKERPVSIQVLSVRAETRLNPTIIGKIPLALSIAMGLLAVIGRRRVHAVISGLRTIPKVSVVAWSALLLGGLILSQLALAHLWPAWRLFLNETQQTSLSVVVIVLVIPICEELWFRGTMFRAMLEQNAAAFGAFASAAMFASLHGVDPANPWSLIRLLFLFLLGLLLAWSYWRTRSLLLPIAIHSTNNAIAILS